MEQVDITIVGAGVIGLSIAAQVAGNNRTVLVIEQHDSFGRETSSRNSEVVHAGIYYRPGSLKAQKCIEGNNILYEICKENNIPYKKTGKLIVATEDSEVSQLEELLKNGLESGAEGLRMVKKKEIKQLEPSVEAIAALYSPSTGIIDSHKLMEYFISSAKNKGTDIVYNSEVKDINKEQDGYEVIIRDVDGENFSFLSKIFINCAGLNSDNIARMVGINIEKSDYTLKYSKGEYFRLYNPGRWNISHLVYPVPEKEGVGLGIHLTLDLAGGIRLGPDANYIAKEDFDYNVDETKKETFYKSVKKFLPSLKLDDLYPDIAGIRPVLKGSGDDFRDFIIKNEEDKDFPGFINLIGIESPGLTSSPAIARYVSKLING